MLFRSTRILSNLGGRVYVWDATSGERIAGLLVAEDDKDYALSASYLPDGRYAIVVTRNGIIKKWDILTNRLISERVMSEFHIEARRGVPATFSPDRKSVVFGDDEGKIRVWNVDTGEQNGGPFEGHIDSITCLSFSSDGKYLASGSGDGTVIIQDMDSRRLEISPLREHTGRVTAVSFSPCGTKLVSGSFDNTILVGMYPRERCCARLSVRMKYARLLTHLMDSLSSRGERRC